MFRKYQYTPEMGEISGFGGNYEEMCRRMVIAGLEWWDANPEADPMFRGFKGIYGLITDENEDAKALTDAIIKATDDKGITGAMHQAAINHIMAVRKNGWEWYVEEMSKEDEDV